MNLYSSLVLLSYMMYMYFLACTSTPATAATVKLPLYRKELKIDTRSLQYTPGLQKAKSSDETLRGDDDSQVQPAHNVPVISDLRNLATYTFIGVGTPPQSFKVAIATANATSDLWVLSVDCDNIGCIQHRRYNHTQSTTYVKNGTQYDDILSSGYLSQDTVTIAGLKVSGQVFGEATETGTFDVLTEYEGYMNLGIQPVSQTSSIPLFYSLLKQNLIDEAVFGMYLATENGDSPGTGELTLGGRDPDHYVGELTYTKLVSKQLWQFKIDSISSKSKYNNSIVILPGCQSGCNALIDSVNPFVLGPKRDIDTLNKALGAINPDPEDNFIEYFDCETIYDLPNVIFNIAGRDFELSWKHYVLSLDREICLSAFIGALSETQWDLGVPFLQAVYTEFDVGNSQLGFAKSRYQEN